MSVITPGAFHGSSANSFTAARLRRVIQSISGDREGVIGAGDLLVSATAPAGMRVSVAAGRALVNGDAVARQGAYLEELSQGVEVGPIAPAHPTLARIDLVAMRVFDQDSVANGGGGDASDVAQIVVIAGTPAANPVAPSLPGTAIPLAHVSVAVGTSAIASGAIADVRPFAVIAPTARVRRALASQSVPPGTLQHVLFDFEDEDTNQMWSPASASAIFIRTPGAYMLSASVLWLDGGDTARRFAELLITPGQVSADSRAALAGAQTHQSMSLGHSLAPPTTVQLRVEHNAPTARSLFATLTATRVGA